MSQEIKRLCSEIKPKLHIFTYIIALDQVIWLINHEVNQSKRSSGNHNSIFHLNYQFEIIYDKFMVDTGSWSLLKCRFLYQELLNMKYQEWDPTICIYFKAPKVILMQPALQMSFECSLGMRLSEINIVNLGRQKRNQTNCLIEVYT